jgi:hypothetical protein
MKKFISLCVFGILSVATTTALAGPPARSTSDYPVGAKCSAACIVNVAPGLTRAKLYSTVVPRCHQKQSAAVRWGNPPDNCPQSTQVASCN